MSPLSPSEFSAFFREVNNGTEPFPWQKRLALGLFQSGVWPELLDIPTGAGKTAVLDIAVFHLALEADRGTGRRAPVRLAFVVDRRLIVDQAYERAKQLQAALDNPSTRAVAVVAERLKSLSGDDRPLTIQELRGGLPRESDWARTPVQPTILVSTVDQVGSRLLFRGYGVSNSMRPVHAGLLGSDCHIFLDEAHLSEPFRQSLKWVSRYRNKPWTEAEQGPWGVTALSATPGLKSSEEPFRLGPPDFESPELRRRIRATKPTELREISSTNLAQTYASCARELAAHERIERVLMVVNRVDLARAIFDELASERPFLLTGRVREIDREHIVQQIQDALQGESKGKLFVVSTQCIEAGADYDFDALVTQTAPLDALRQRFGRLNRRGRDIPARGVILATKEDLPAKKPDPVYGLRPRPAWDLLKKIARKEGKREIVDFGSAALSEALSSFDTAPGCCEKPDAPLMPPAYLDLWSLTNPPPTVEPDVALFLHGPERASADVEIVWRGDLDPEDLGSAKSIVSALPPRAGETLSVPIWRVRQWLSGSREAGRVADIEGEREPESNLASNARRVLRWRGADDERTSIISADQIRPADIIVVPCAYGGCDEWGWTGLSEPPVPDRALEAAARLRSREIAIRLHPNLLPESWHEISRLISEFSDEPRLLLDVLRGSTALPEIWRDELLDIRPNTVDVVSYPGEQGVILTGNRKENARRAAEPITESDRLSNRSEDGLGVALRDHTTHVVEKARTFGRAAGLGERVRSALEFAAKLHDAGKGDGRFQALLSNADIGSRVLAKSGRGTGSGSEQALPPYWRHEALSVRVAMNHPDFSEDMDRDLALWLIGTHHGWGRPFFPHDDEMDDCPRVIYGANCEPIRLNAGSGPQRLDFAWNGRDWAGLFDALRRRYGVWELARLEATLRLADHRASEEDGATRERSVGSGTR